MTVQVKENYICDQCGLNYMLDVDEQMPPQWILAHLVIANSRGRVADHEREQVYHYCGLQCMLEHLSSGEFRARVSFSEREEEEFDEEDDQE